MIPYATPAEAEAALGRAMTRAEAAWYQYSAAMPDSWLHCHTTFILFVIYTITPLPLVVLEQFAPSVVLPYKLQPRVRLPLAASLRCYMEAACFFPLAVGFQLVSYPAAVKVVYYTAKLYIKYYFTCMVAHIRDRALARMAKACSARPAHQWSNPRSRSRFRFSMLVLTEYTDGCSVMRIHRRALAMSGTS